MADRLLTAQLSAYLDGLVPQRPDEIQQMEAYADEHNFPIVGPASGQFCYTIARLIGARRIFELGSGYGYSTAWFARAVVENGGGEVHHVVWDDDLSQRARRHLGELGYAGTVAYHVGEAIETLKGVDGPFDLMFNDIDKHAYPESIPVIAEKLRPGGVVIIDNMLLGGRVLDADDDSRYTAAVRETTEMLAQSDDWAASLIPIRDGLMMAMKK